MQCIPEKIIDQAWEQFSEYDGKSLFPEEQTEIAKKLLKLRVTFAENKKIDKQYRVDIKQLDFKNSIYLHSSDPEHKVLKQKGAFIGVELLKQKWIKSDLVSRDHPIKFLSVEEWNSMNKMSKFQKLI